MSPLFDLTQKTLLVIRLNIQVQVQLSDLIGFAIFSVVLSSTMVLHKLLHAIYFCLLEIVSADPIIKLLLDIGRRSRGIFHTNLECLTSFPVIVIHLISELHPFVFCNTFNALQH